MFYFHTIICYFFGLPFVHYKVLREIWGEVIKHDGYLQTEIKSIENLDHAFYYVGKYMRKLPEGAEWSPQEAKDEARKVWCGVNDDPTCGFTLFVENAAEWIWKLGELEETNSKQFNANGEYDPIPF